MQTDKAVPLCWSCTLHFGKFFSLWRLWSFTKTKKSDSSLIAFLSGTVGKELSILPVHSDSLEPSIMLWSPGLDLGLPVVVAVAPGSVAPERAGSGSDPGRWPGQGCQNLWIASRCNRTPGFISTSRWTQRRPRRKKGRAPTTKTPLKSKQERV